MYELQVEGMSCGHCASTVTKLVKQLDQGAKVEVDLAGKKVKVESGIAPGEIAEALTEGGYPARAA
ncbi:MAG: heavy-metal-associated domain-containing protein [Proteobacteria bacterium]|nr:heavy-metal-associated domain-containing protein [Pseudomonadota bacterium]